MAKPFSTLRAQLSPESQARAKEKARLIMDLTEWRKKNNREEYQAVGSKWTYDEKGEVVGLTGKIVPVRLGTNPDLLIVDEFYEVPQATAEDPAPTTEETLIYYRDLLYEACSLFDTDTETCWLSELPRKIRELQEKVELLNLVDATQQACIEQQKEEIQRLKTEQNHMVSLELYEKSAAKCTEMLQLSSQIADFIDVLPCFFEIRGEKHCGACEIEEKLNKFKGLQPKPVEYCTELNETVEEAVPAIEPQFPLHGIVKGIAEELKAGRNPFQVTVTDELKARVRKLPCYDYGDTAPRAYGAFCREKRTSLNWEECAVCPNAQASSADPSEEILYHSQSSTWGSYEWDKK
jgi:hypothetical protein